MTTIDHDLRSKGVGSSEIAMLVPIPGTAKPMSPWGGPHTLWRRKTGRDDGPKETAQMSRGHYAEIGLRQWYGDQHGCDPWVPPTTLLEPGIVDSADGLAWVGGWLVALECKTVHYSQRKKWGEQGTDQIPAHYLLQCQWHCLVHGAARCDVPADFGDSYALYSVPRNERIMGVLRRKALRFWRDHVLADVPPPLDMDDATSSWLNSHMEWRGSYREATGEEVALIHSVRDNRADAAAVKAGKPLSEVPLKEAIGELDGLTIDGEVAVTYRPDKRGRRSIRLK